MGKNQTLIAISFLFGIASIIFIWFAESSIVSALTKEDGVVENLSVIFYMISIIICFISIFKTEHVLLPIVWAVLCFIFLGEETSWFQRLFDYSVPLVEQINAQSEFNLHNLNIFHGGNLTESSIELSVFLKSQNLFRLGFFAYFLVIPLLVYMPIIRELMSKIGYNKPVTSFTLILFLVFALSFFITLFAPQNVKSALAETREMLYAFFIMQYIIAYIWPSKKMQPTPCIGG